MEVMFWYSLFALATSFTCLYELVKPVINQLDSKNVIVEYKYISYITFFLLSVLLAPLVIFPCIVPSAGNRFREALLTSLV